MYHVILCDYVCIYVAYPCPVYRILGGYCVEDTNVPLLFPDLPIVAVATILPRGSLR